MRLFRTLLTALALSCMSMGTAFSAPLLLASCETREAVDALAATSKVERPLMAPPGCMFLGGMYSVEAGTDPDFTKLYEYTDYEGDTLKVWSLTINGELKGYVITYNPMQPSRYRI